MIRALELGLTGQCVELQGEELWSLGLWWRGKLEGEALLLGTAQQGLGQGGLMEQQVEEVSRRHTVEGFGAGAEV